MQSANDFVIKNVSARRIENGELIVYESFLSVIHFCDSIIFVIPFIFAIDSFLSFIIFLHRDTIHLYVFPMSTLIFQIKPLLNHILSMEVTYEWHVVRYIMLTS